MSLVIKSGNIITGIIETIFNTVFGQSTGGFFGQSPQKDPETGKVYNPEKKLVKDLRSHSCNFQLLCPPFYVFLKKGLSGWIYILIDLLLTAFFYFPGLIYAVITCPICFLKK